MKSQKFLLIFFIVCLVVANSWFITPVSASVHEGINILGLSTTTDDSGEFNLLDPPLGTFDLHLVVYGFDYDQGIVGWECQVILPEGVQATGITLEGKTDPAGADVPNCNIRVFPKIPIMPIGGVAHLATLHLMLIDHLSDIEFFLAPFSSDTPYDSMGFYLQTSGPEMIPFNWPGDCSDCSVFGLNKTPDAVEESSWDQLKSLFR